MGKQYTPFTHKEWVESCKHLFSMMLDPAHSQEIRAGFGTTIREIVEEESVTWEELAALPVPITPSEIDRRTSLDLNNPTP